MISLDSHDSILVATIDRNDQNTIDDSLVEALDRMLDEAERRQSVLLHVRSARAHFCGGADPVRVRRWLESDGAAALTADSSRWSSLFERIEATPTIVFAEIRGNALGAGLGLALACDLRMMSTSSWIGVPEVRVGLLPAGNTIRRLTELSGLVAAQRLLIAGDIIDGAEAHRLGLAHWLSDEDSLKRNAAEAAQRVAKQSPAALREAKRLLASASRESRNQTATIERQAFSRLIASEEPRKKIEALLVRLASRG